MDHWIHCQKDVKWNFGPKLDMIIAAEAVDYGIRGVVLLKFKDGKIKTIA